MNNRSESQHHTLADDGPDLKAELVDVVDGKHCSAIGYAEI